MPQPTATNTTRIVLSEELLAGYSRTRFLALFYIVFSIFDLIAQSIVNLIGEDKDEYLISFLLLLPEVVLISISLLFLRQLNRFLAARTEHSLVEALQGQRLYFLVSTLAFFISLIASVAWIFFRPASIPAL